MNAYHHESGFSVYSAPDHIMRASVLFARLRVLEMYVAANPEHYQAWLTEALKTQP